MTVSEKAVDAEDDVAAAAVAVEDDVDILESLEAEADPEEDLEHFVAILVESLSRLGKLPEAIEQIKSKMQSQLMAVITRYYNSVRPAIRQSVPPFACPFCRLPVRFALRQYILPVRPAVSPFVPPFTRPTCPSSGRFSRSHAFLSP